MRVKRRHWRDLDATPEEVAQLIAGLGSDHDQLWPSEHWPGTVIAFDRPLAVGARGGHGLIRYSVEQYEPTRRVTFRFDPGEGLDGTHGLAIEPLAGGRTRLVHSLDTRLEGAVRLAKPMLERMHDTLVRQLLDRAELATAGRVVHPVRMPLWMRATNAVEARLINRARVSVHGGGHRHDLHAPRRGDRPRRRGPAGSAAA